MTTPRLGEAKYLAQCHRPGRVEATGETPVHLVPRWQTKTAMATVCSARCAPGITTLACYSSHCHLLLGLLRRLLTGRPACPLVPLPLSSLTQSQSRPSSVQYHPTPTFQLPPTTQNKIQGPATAKKRACLSHTISFPPPSPAPRQHCRPS